MLWSSYQRLGVISRETGEACKGFDSAVAHGTLAGCPKSTGQEAPEHGIS
jgi:hypothetical protein